MSSRLRAYEMVEATSPDEIGLMKQQRRIEEAQRLRRQKQAAETQRLGGKQAPPRPAAAARLHA